MSVPRRKMPGVWLVKDSSLYFRCDIFVLWKSGENERTDAHVAYD